jgi:hypothetical protein
MEDFFLADACDAQGFGSVAEWIRNADTHEAVEEIRAGVLRVLEPDEVDDR